MYKFIYESEVSEISLTVSSDSSLSDMFDAFHGFMIATGFKFKGSIELIEDDCKGPELTD